MNPATLKNVWNTTSNNRVLLALGSPDFINQTNIHCILNLLLKDSKNYIYQYDAFYCKNEENLIGANIMEMANAGDLFQFLNTVATINEKLIISIFKQVFSVLIQLKNYHGFTHNDLKPKNIFVSCIGSGYEFKIADYDKSSIFFNGVHFYNNSVSDIITSPIKNKNDLFSLQMNSLQSKLYTMYASIPFFESYDYYTFMFTFLRVPSITKYYVDTYYQNINDHVITNLLKIMFQSHYTEFINDLFLYWNSIKDQHHDYDDIVTKGQSITHANDYLFTSSFEYKKVLSPAIEIYLYNITEDIKIIPPSIGLKPDHTLTISQQEKLCKSPCLVGKCDTVLYSSYGSIYAKDSCKTDISGKENSKPSSGGWLGSLGSFF